MASCSSIDFSGDSAMEIVLRVILEAIRWYVYRLHRCDRRERQLPVGKEVVEWRLVTDAMADLSASDALSDRTP